MAQSISQNDTEIPETDPFTASPGIICRICLYIMGEGQLCLYRICGFSRSGFDRPDLQILETPIMSSKSTTPENRIMPFKSTGPSMSTPDSYSSHDENNDDLLQFTLMKILFPIVMILIGICIILGIVLIVKSYMVAPIKYNLATAIRRRRRFGHAPDNNYVPSEEMRASQRWSCSSPSDRKSLPPPEVLMAARARASQMLHV